MKYFNINHYENKIGYNKQIYFYIILHENKLGNYKHRYIFFILGTMLLDIEATDLPSIVNHIIDNMIIHDQIKKFQLSYLGPLVILLPKTSKLFGFPIFRL
jgi:hypothetical protein